MRSLGHNCWIAALVLFAWLAVAPASAQPRSSGAVDPDQYQRPPTIAWVMCGVFLAASLVVVFKNPKRTHQG